MKRTVGIIMLFMVAALFVIFAGAESESPVLSTGTWGSAKYTLFENGTLVINGKGAMGNARIVYAGQMNTSPRRWGSNEKIVNNVIIEDGITSIGDFAFYRCSNLESITIPDSVVTIGSDAFHFCNKLKEISIPNSVKTIEGYAFGQTGLKELRIPASVESIWWNAAYSNPALEKIVFEQGSKITKLDYQCFWECAKLKEIVLPKTIETIEGSCFLNCKSLKDVYYEGTEEEWNTISISSNNDPLMNATIHFNYDYTDKHFPEGYDFDRDKFNFLNYTDWFLEKKYFQNIFGPAPGKLAYDEHKWGGQGGLCFGMAMATASVFNNLPSVNQIKFGKNPRDCICNIEKSDSYFLLNKTSQFDDFIKTCYVSQWSSAVQRIRSTKTTDITNLLNEVKQYTDNNRLGIVIDLFPFHTDPDGNDVTEGGHTILAVGYQGNDILVDDSNSQDIQRFIVRDDGTWKYSNSWTGYELNNTNAKINYNTNYSNPYFALTANINPALENQARDTTNFVDGEKLLLSTPNNSICIDSNDIIKITDITGNENQEGEVNSNLFWINTDKTVSLLNNGDNSATCSLAGGKTILSALVPPTAEAKMTIDKPKEEVILKSTKGEQFSISVESIDNEESFMISIYGVVAYDTVFATQTDTGITVTGLNDMTITYSVNDEVVAETTAAVTDGREVHITVDEDAEQVTTDFLPHEHSYTAAVTQEPTCIETGVTTYTCICGESYTETIPALGHTDADSNGNCTRCGTHIADVEKTDTCPYCGKEHTGKNAKWTYIVHLVFWFLLNIIGILKK